MLAKTLNHEQDIPHSFNIRVMRAKPKALGVIPVDGR